MSPLSPRFDLIDSATGRSPFPAPLSLEAVLQMRVERLSLADGTLTVEVTLAGAPVDQLAILFLAKPETVYGYRFALRVRSDRSGRSLYVGTLRLLTLLPIDISVPLTVFVSGRRLKPPMTVVAL